MCMSVLGCTTDEDRIRSVVRNELGSSAAREYIRDARTFGPYTPAQRIGGHLYLSGQIGIDPASGNLISEMFCDQVCQIMQNIESILKSAGYELDDLVSTTIYLTDMNDFQEMNEIYSSFFNPDKYPARTTVQVAVLPRNARIEITGVAFKSH